LPSETFFQPGKISPSELLRASWNDLPFPIAHQYAEVLSSAQTKAATAERKLFETSKLFHNAERRSTNTC